VTFKRAYLLRMSCLPLLDLGMTGIFILITQRFDALAQVVFGMGLLGVIAVGAGVVLYRPIRRYEESGEAANAAAARIQALPRYSATVTFAAVLCYCYVSFALGTFTPPDASLAGISTFTVGVAIFWYALLYAVLYSYFIYYFVHDLTLSMRRQHHRALDFSPMHERIDGTDRLRRSISKKLTESFLVIGVLPALLLTLDLTVFAPIRAAQGLSTQQVIALDILASLYVIIASIVFVSRALLASTRELFIAQDAVARGDLSHKAAVLTDDELGEVTQRFNVMVDALRERELMRTTLHRYLSPEVATELIASGGVLESRSVEATVMFTDIQGFTALSETLDPQETVELLNAYFALVNRVITDAGGTVNNFIGDAVVAMFNVPTPHPSHARAAIEAAMRMHAEIEAAWFTLRSGRRVQLPTRIGVNTGPVCAGAIGSSERQGYTVYGDAVNLAARIEPLNKRFCTRILLAGETVRLAAQQGFDVSALESLGDVSVAGRQRAVEVFAVRALGRADDNARDNEPTTSAPILET
jgi:class 3 adenylate cyclase